MDTEFNTQNENLKIDEASKSFFLEMAKWTKFLSILGFISLGIMVLVAFSIRSLISNLPNMGGMGTFSTALSGFFTFIYVAIAIVYYFPIKYLYDFSTKVKKALEQTNQQLFNEAIAKLKSHYKFIGIVTVIIFSMYVLIFGFSILAAVFSSMY